MIEGYTEWRKRREAGTTTAVEEVRRFLANIDDRKNINAFITITGEAAEAAAEESDRRFAEGTARPLEGLVVAVKDNISTKGVRTTCASSLLSNFSPIYDATVVTRLQAAGAICIGKSNLDEFAMGSSNETSAFGIVRNPVNEEYVPGGSSGGSAAAVAGQMCHVALGSDTGGSVRLPAAFCGVIGYKPTYGRISRYGLVAFASSLDQIGIFAHTAEDIALVLEHIGGTDEADATSLAVPAPRLEEMQGILPKSFTFAVPASDELEGCSEEIIASLDKAAKVLEAIGGTKVEVSLRHKEIYIPTYYIIATAEASSNLARFEGVRYGQRVEEGEDMMVATRSSGFGAEVQRRIMLGTFVLSSGYYDAYYNKALLARKAIQEYYDEIFAQSAVFLLPTAADTAFRIGEKAADPLAMYLSDLFTVTANIAGIPALSLPAGTSSNGLPLAVQIQTAAPQDSLLLAFADYLTKKLA